jgi:hypothetical protein
MLSKEKGNIEAKKVVNFDGAVLIGDKSFGW